VGKLRIVTNGRLQTAVTELARIRLLFLALMVFGAALLIVGFYGFVQLSSLDNAFLQSLPVLAVLIASITATSRVMPFNQLFMVCNRPGLNTYLYLAVLVVNIALNAALIPLFGILGAAVATGASILMFGAMIHIIAARVLSVKL